MKFPRPFFRSARNCWYVQIGKQQLRLHPDEDEAIKLYHELMTKRAVNPVHVVSSELTVAEVFDKFLIWCEKHRAKRTFEGYKKHIQRFCKALPETESMPSSQLRPFH